MDGWAWTVLAVKESKATLTLEAPGILLVAMGGCPGYLDLPIRLETITEVRTLNRTWTKRCISWTVPAPTLKTAANKKKLVKPDLQPSWLRCADPHSL